MWNGSSSFTAALLLVLLIASCESSLELLLYSYTNPSSSCCDNQQQKTCSSVLNPCNNKLTLCLLEHGKALNLETTNLKLLKCPAGWKAVNIGRLSMNSDTLLFTTGENGFRNPITLEGEQWKRGFKLLGLVSGFDTSQTEKLVYILAGTVPGLGETFQGPFKFRGIKIFKNDKGAPKLTLKARVTDIDSIDLVPPSFGGDSQTTAIPTLGDSQTTAIPTLGDSQTTAIPTLGLTTVLSETSSSILSTTIDQTSSVFEISTVSQTTSIPIDNSSILFGNDGRQVDTNSGSGDMVAQIVGGVFGAILFIIALMVILVGCIACSRRKQDDLIDKNESEVTALRNGPQETPQFQSNTLSSATSSAYQFSNSLYGALSEETQNTHRIVSPAPASRSPVHLSPALAKVSKNNTLPKEPNYHVVTREYMDSSATGTSNAGYSVISREHMEESSPNAGYSEISREHMGETSTHEPSDGYSEVSREHMQDGEYSYITRENLEEDEGYFVISRDNIAEAEDSDNELLDQQESSKLLLDSK